jgi:uncharacterized lipoprotein YddW (UPF0748 family)
MSNDKGSSKSQLGFRHSVFVLFPFCLEEPCGFFVNRAVIRLVLCLLMLTLVSVRAASFVPSNISPPLPEREFRGAWVASVNNIDWPSKRGLPTAQQQSELLAILDRCQDLKLNVIVLQVRPACDALYSSSIEPWSEYLTGTQGKAPNPFWDPLEFAVREAHTRGLELHAWFNPFRARHSAGSGSASPAHISRTHPTWAKAYGKSLWLDPGLPEVHDYSLRVILDVVKRYDLDGIHIDDYFYPYREKDKDKKDIPFPDWTSWLNYQKSGGKLSRDDWRRDNVNRFIARMYREVKAAKPWVKVGISPFGIYRPGYPAQIKGFDQYESIYADPRAWLTNGWLDYLAPQLYWRNEPAATSFSALLRWWVEHNPRHKLIVPGLNTTAIGSNKNYTSPDAGNRGWPASEIVQQVEITRQLSAAGHIHWNMSALMKNKGNVAGALADEYKNMALAPALSTGAGQRLPAPQVTSRFADKGIEFHVQRLADIRFWWVQTRRSDGTWYSAVEPGNTFVRAQGSTAAVAIRAVDKWGNLGNPTVLERQP